MTGELFVRRANTRSRVESNNRINAMLLAPFDNTVKMPDAAAGPVFAFMDDILVHPVSNRDANGIETKTCNLLDVIFCDPSLPVFLEGGVGFVLTDAFDACPFVVVGTAAHVLPRFFGHPSFDYKLRAEIDAADFIIIWKPSLGNLLAVGFCRRCLWSVF